MAAMRQYLVSLLVAAVAVLYAGLPVVRAQEWFTDADPILTQDARDVVGDHLMNEVDNPIRGGSYDLSEGLNGIYNDEELEDTETSRDRTTRYIKGVINYILGIIGLIALIYMLYKGYIVLTAGSDEEQYNKGMQGIKYAFIAILGVGLSWFILSIVFWLLQLVTNTS